jgi:thymidylate synthase ThyX
MHNATLVWITPKAEELITYCARVSNPKNQSNMETAPKLIRYLLKHKHLSPFEMANMTVEINTSRAVSPQILRHRSLSFQEFCLAGDTRITIVARSGAIQRVPIEELYRKWQNPKFTSRKARSYDPAVERFINADILSVYQSGIKSVFAYEIKGSLELKRINCTREHRVLTKEKGFVPFVEAFNEGLSIALSRASLRLPRNEEAEWGKIISETYIGDLPTYDIEMDHPTHNFVANGVVVHNSLRYSDVREIGSPIPLPHLRRQDSVNRQASHDDLDPDLTRDLDSRIDSLYEHASDVYGALLDAGVAKECAREVLPLGVPTRLYANGTIRSWLTYIALREKNGTQLEHQLIALACKAILCEHCPAIAEALGGPEAPWVI